MFLVHFNFFKNFLFLFNFYLFIYLFTFCHVNFKLSRFLVNIKMVFSPLSLVGAKLPDDP